MINRQCPSYVLYTAIVMISIITGCRKVDNTLYMRYVDVPSDCWRYPELINFMPWPADSADYRPDMKVDIVLYTRFRINPPIAPLPVLLNVEDCTGTIRNDTIFLQTFTPDGKPSGPARHGVAEIADTLFSDFTLKPELSISLIPLDNSQRTNGILNLGIKLIDHESALAQSR